MAMNQILIRVAGADIFVFSPYSETLNWVTSTIEKKFKGHYKEIKNGETVGWKDIQDFKDHDEALNNATWLVRELLTNGWKHMNIDVYVEGNWFQKG